MSILNYQQNELSIEEVSLTAIADTFGTPCYIYSKAQIERNWQAFDTGFKGIPHRICYAVKANSNLAILTLLAKQHSGFDIVSLGEFERVLAAGGDPSLVIFSGVGKSAFEIEQAMLKNVGCFDIESLPELARIHQIADRLQKKVDIAFRLNPNIAADTHAYIATGRKENKFGINGDHVPYLCQQLANMPWVNLIGIAAHIGSQITELTPFIDTVKYLLHVYQELKALGFNLKHIDIGGGLGITYAAENPPSIDAYAKAIKEALGKQPFELIIEPGRAIIANAGVLLTRVEYLKQEGEQHFAIVDAGMNDLIRPALYSAWQNILPVTLRQGDKIAYDVAGPVCESADFFGKNRLLTLEANDLLAIDTAGAYGFSMSSNYNARPRPPEVLIDGNHMQLIRRRETMQDMLACELNLPA